MNLPPAATLYQEHTSGGGSLSYRQIATKYRSSYHRVRNAVRAYQSNDADHALPELPSERMRTDERRMALERYLGTALINIPAKHSEPVERRRVFACGDLHGRSSEHILKQLINYDPDIVVLGGDLFDSRQASPHGGRPDPAGEDEIHDEMVRLRAWIEIALLRTHAVFHIQRGNHDDWLVRAFADYKIPAWMMKYVNDPFDLLLAELPPERTIKAASVYSWMQPNGGAPLEFAESQYMYCLGDALISHGSFADKNAGGAVRKLALWLERWRRLVGIDPVLLVQMHSHKISYARDQDGWAIWVEPGMACEPLAEAYKFNQHRTSWTPGARGAVTFEQEHIDGQWRTVRDSVRLVF